MAQASETRETRIKRLKIRSWRRGMKEMDLILGRYADTELDGLDAEMLNAYEALIAEPDNDLYVWFSKEGTAPECHLKMIDVIQKNFV